MSQKAEILEYLRTGRTLTPIEALQRFGCLSLSQRIGELKRAGHPVVGVVIQVPTGKRVACYSWAGRRTT